MKRAFAVLLLSTGLAACGGDDAPAGPTGPAQLVTEDITVGTGAVAANGDVLTVHYLGTFLDGRKFDSSYDVNRPFQFRLGNREVILGWDQGIPGMRIGGKRRLTIPSALAYGSQGNGPIPPNTPLRFEVELLAIAGK